MLMIIRKSARFFAIGALLAPAMAHAQDPKPTEAPTQAEVQAQKEAKATYLDAMTKLQEARTKAEAEVTQAMDRAKAAQAQAEASAKSAKNQAFEALRSLEQIRGAKVPVQAPRPTLNTRTVTVRSRSSAVPDALQANFGLKLAAIDESLRAQLDIPKGEGVVVLESKPGALADKAGLKANDVILSLGNNAIVGVDEAREVLMKLGKDAVQVNLIRGGKPRQISLVGVEHGIPAAPTEYWVGIPVAPIDATLRSHFTNLPADTGLIATDVVAKSPAETAGVKRYDILISIGGNPLKVRESLASAVQATEGKPVVFKVIRAGKLMSITVTPETRPASQPMSVTISGQDNKFLFYRSIDPKLGIAIAEPTSGEIPKAGDVVAEAPFTLDLNIDKIYGNFVKDIDSETIRKAITEHNAASKAKADESIQAAIKSLQSSVDALSKRVEEMAKTEKK